MKRLIFTIALILGVAAVGLGLLADAKAKECRAEVLDGQGPLGVAIIGAAMDASAPGAAEKFMTRAGVPDLLRPLARPLFIADRYCAAARGVKK